MLLLYIIKQFILLESDISFSIESDFDLIAQREMNWQISWVRVLRES